MIFPFNPPRASPTPPLESPITTAASARERGMKNGVKGKLVFRGGWSAGGWEDDRGRGGLDWGGVIDQSRCDSSERIHKRREKNGKQAS